MTQPSIAIITKFYNNINYGGVLQAYALTYILNSLNYNAQQLLYIESAQNTVNQTNKITTFFKSSNPTKILKTSVFYAYFLLSLPVRKYIHRKIIPFRNIRLANFTHFNEKYIPSSSIYSNSTIASIGEKYDIFITGSDQVWNPTWPYSPYFLDFVPDNRPKIAYAASIALSSLTGEQYAKMQPLIARFDAISVREKNAVNLLKDMTDKAITWIADPTLLLTKNQWSRIAASHEIKEPFVFAYILGDKRENKKAAERFAKEKHLKLVTAPFVGSEGCWQFHFGDYQCYEGPDVFVSLIRDAEYVITDSFHAVVFSTLFHKRFVVLKRHADSDKIAMNERLYSLFEITGMSRQLVSPDEISRRIEYPDYSGVDERIEKMRDFSLQWLLHALDSTL